MQYIIYIYSIPSMKMFTAVSVKVSQFILLQYCESASFTIIHRGDWLIFLCVSTVMWINQLYLRWVLRVSQFYSDAWILRTGQSFYKRQVPWISPFYWGGYLQVARHNEVRVIWQIGGLPIPPNYGRKQMTSVFQTRNLLPGRNGRNE